MHEPAGHQSCMRENAIGVRETHWQICLQHLALCWRISPQVLPWVSGSTEVGLRWRKGHKRCRGGQVNIHKALSGGCTSDTTRYKRGFYFTITLPLLPLMSHKDSPQKASCPVLSLHHSYLWRSPSQYTKGAIPDEEELSIYEARHPYLRRAPSLFTWRGNCSIIGRSGGKVPSLPEPTTVNQPCAQSQFSVTAELEHKVCIIQNNWEFKQKSQLASMTAA